MAPSTTAASATAAALSVLAGCNLKELHLKRADGSRILDSLHATCRSAGLIPAGTPDSTPKERYLAVFDAALHGGLGLWILDYVEVVCADRHLTSNDPLEAYLLDGGFVKAWAQACLVRAEQAAESALKVDTAFTKFQQGPLQLQLAQMRSLVAVLRALDRIRSGGSVLGAAAPGVGAQSGVSGVQDRLSVKAELRQALLLEQAFQVMDWCARQGLADPRVASAGRFVSYTDWSRAVNARRSRAAPRPLFLDALLQSLSLSGAYPSTSVQHMLHTLLLVVRDVEPAAWAAKLALLSYYLLDSGVLDGPGGSAAAAPGAAAGSEAALEDLRRTFRLPPGEVGLWQCHYLLDCALPDSPGSNDPHLARACALLPACVTADTPFAFIEALLALGRPDVALAVDRGQSGSTATTTTGAAAAACSGSSRTCRTLTQATTLLDIRLRCGLMTEAFTLLRDHTAELAARGEPPDVVRSHTQVLLRRLAAWALEQDTVAAAGAGQLQGTVTGGAQMASGCSSSGSAGGDGSRWLNRLTELPLNATEETVLVGWLAEEGDAGRPAGAFLPLFFLQRGRVNEATAAFGRWSRRQDALAAAGCAAVPTTSGNAALISAAVDAAYRSLVPANLRNVAVPPVPQGSAGGSAAGGPGSALPPALPSTEGGGLAPVIGGASLQGAVGILDSYVVNDNPEQPIAVLPFHGTEPPPLVTSAVPLPPGPTAPQAPPAATAAAAAPAAPSQPPLLLPAPQPQTMVSMPLMLPSSAPFRAPPGTPGLVPGGGSTAATASTFGAGGGGGSGLLFSLGAGGLTRSGSGGGAPGGPGGAGGFGMGGTAGFGTAAAAPAGVPPAMAPPRSSKRSKPNTWM